MKLSFLIILTILFTIGIQVNANVVYMNEEEEVVEIASNDKSDQFIMVATSTKTSTKTIPKTATGTIPTNTVISTSTSKKTKTIPVTTTTDDNLYTVDGSTITTITYTDSKTEYRAKTTFVPVDIGNIYIRCDNRNQNVVICDFNDTCYTYYSTFYDYDRGKWCVMYTTVGEEYTNTYSTRYLTEDICESFTTKIVTDYITKSVDYYRTQSTVDANTVLDIYRSLRTLEPSVHPGTRCITTRTAHPTTTTTTTTSTLSKSTNVSTLNPNQTKKVTSLLVRMEGCGGFGCVETAVMTVPGTLSPMIGKCSQRFSYPTTAHHHSTKAYKTIAKVVSTLSISKNTSPSVTSTIKVPTKSIPTSAKQIASRIYDEDEFYDQYGQYYKYYTYWSRLASTVSVYCDMFTQATETPTETVKTISHCYPSPSPSVTTRYRYIGDSYTTYTKSNADGGYSMTIDNIYTSTLSLSTYVYYYCTMTTSVSSSSSQTTTTSSIPITASPSSTISPSSIEIPISTVTPSTKCIPQVVTVTEKNIITVTEKETVTVTVTEDTNPIEEDQQCAPKWAQCGGQNYDGPTCCQAGYTCHKLNEYYHQCI